MNFLSDFQLFSFKNTSIAFTINNTSPSQSFYSIVIDDRLNIRRNTLFLFLDKISIVQVNPYLRVEFNNYFKLSDFVTIVKSPFKLELEDNAYMCFISGDFDLKDIKLEVNEGLILKKINDLIEITAFA